METDKFSNLTVWNMRSNITYKNFTTPTLSVYGMAPLDSLDMYTIIFYSNSSIMIYDNSPNVTSNYLKNSTLISFSSQFTDYDFRLNKILIGFNDYFEISGLVC